MGKSAKNSSQWFRQSLLPSFGGWSINVEYPALPASRDNFTVPLLGLSGAKARSGTTIVKLCSLQRLPRGQNAPRLKNQVATLMAGSRNLCSCSFMFLFWIGYNCSVLQSNCTFSDFSACGLYFASLGGGPPHVERRYVGFEMKYLISNKQKETLLSKHTGWPFR